MKAAQDFVPVADRDAPQSIIDDLMFSLFNLLVYMLLVFIGKHYLVIIRRVGRL